MFALLAVNSSNEIVPSQYALDIKALGFDIITWTFERADLRKGAAKAGFYYLFDPQGKAVRKDSDMYKALDVLARQVGIIGIFSDRAATVTYYANGMGLRKENRTVFQGRPLLVAPAIYSGQPAIFHQGADGRIHSTQFRVRKGNPGNSARDALCAMAGAFVSTHRTGTRRICHAAAP